ncbi:maleylpyruvate isomerase family mycothiol-dependent enzyme [Dactylosporangium sp. NPDC050588]|uniref:maleylpyruvate isomerase family mycothiol-dependent enzyme n=1 Tax=Dactylosporangium sp. NPDC050588 TaxID=3157211 RepID=UPI0033E5DC0C
MDAEMSWQVIAEQRRSLADLLEGLTAEQWGTPSLCAGWTVRDVAAHVALAPQPPGFATMLREAARARGSFDRLNHDLAVRHAARSTGRLVAELWEHADSRRLPAVTSYRNIVPDILVHGQDIAVPLGLPHPVPPVAAAAAATRVWTMSWPFWARRRLRRVRLVATDTTWAAGPDTGDEIRGPISALLLLLTGRTAAALPHLSGPGLATTVR